MVARGPRRGGVCPLCSCRSRTARARCPVHGVNSSAILSSSPSVRPVSACTIARGRWKSPKGTASRSPEARTPTWAAVHSDPGQRAQGRPGPVRRERRTTAPGSRPAPPRWRWCARVRGRLLPDARPSSGSAPSRGHPAPRPGAGPPTPAPPPPQGRPPQPRPDLVPAHRMPGPGRPTPVRPPVRSRAAQGPRGRGPRGPVPCAGRATHGRSAGRPRPSLDGHRPRSPPGRRARRVAGGGPRARAPRPDPTHGRAPRTRRAGSGWSRAPPVSGWRATPHRRHSGWSGPRGRG